jgi:hypothetical protein
MIRQFKPKGPAVVSAVQFTGNFDEIEQFVGGDAEFRQGTLVVATRQGPLYASNGDWIVNLGDRFVARTPGEFFTMYEVVE